MPLNVVNSTPLISNLSFNQQNQYLRLLGWSSGSTFVNNIVFVMVLCVIVIVHIVFCLLYCITKSRGGRFSSIVSGTYRFFTFTIYIRIFIEVFMFIFLMIVCEYRFYTQNGGDDVFGNQEEGDSADIKGNYVSITITCFILISSLTFLLCVFIS